MKKIQYAFIYCLSALLIFNLTSVPTLAENLTDDVQIHIPGKEGSVPEAQDPTDTVIVTNSFEESMRVHEDALKNVVVARSSSGYTTTFEKLGPSYFISYVTGKTTTSLGGDITIAAQAKKHSDGYSFGVSFGGPIAFSVGYAGVSGRDVRVTCSSNSNLNYRNCGVFTIQEIRGQDYIERRWPNSNPSQVTTRNISDVTEGSTYYGTFNHQPNSVLKNTSLRFSNYNAALNFAKKSGLNWPKP